MRKIIVLLGFIMPIWVFSQKTITGKVFDGDSNQPLVSASVVAKGTNEGVTTAADGSFTLKISNDVKSVFITYVGYEMHALKVDGATSNFEVRLKPSVDEIQITVIGSRNLSRTKVQTPVPVDVIPVATMAKEVGQIDLNQLLTFSAPSFQSSRQTVSDGTDHVDPAQLRGLGSDQILVLVNGKRRHQSALVNVNGTVNRGQVGTDLNTIPVSSIERVEVLRDGAAAQYGSDAIAGVINIVLKNTTNVLSGNVSYGENISKYPKNYAFGKINNSSPSEVSVHDGGAFQAGLNYGISLDKKGFINLTGEYSLRNRSNRAGTYTGAVYANVNGANRDDSILNARGLTRNNFDMRVGNSKISSGAFMLNAGYNLSTNWKLKVFGGYSQKSGEAAGVFRYPSAISTAATIYAPQVFAQYPNGFLPLIKTDIKDYSLSIGLDGKLGKWNASLSNTLGVNTFDFNVDNSINYTQLAVSTGTPQTKFTAGGLQFLQNTINADLTRNFDVLQGLNIAYGAEFRVDQYAQNAGEEASYKNYNTNSGAGAGAQVFAGFIPAYANKHSRNNVGLYVDLEQDFTKQWLVETALRFENYSDFGSTLNYKIATRYKISDHFTIRGASSSGFRAPSMQQKYYAKTNTLFVSTPAGLVATESGTFTNDSKPAEILGIPKLKEETSQNYSVGFTTSPVRGLEITVDGYLINIKNRIILTNNFTGGNNATLTQLLKDNGATTANFFTNAIDTRAKGIEAVVSYRTSFADENRLRFTLAATFIKNEVKKGDDGKPIIKASDILVNSGQLANYFNREDQSRIEVASPTSKGNFTINYGHRKLGVMLRFAYFGKVTYLDPTINPANPAGFPVNAFTSQKETLDQEFDPKTVTDLSLSYDLTKDFTLTLGSNNIFDVYQDKHNHSGNVSTGRFIYSRRVQQMGYNGRYVFARVSFNIAPGR
ncbi:MAG: TonB-dependent receptor [Ferruginibacter sp.]